MSIMKYLITVIGISLIGAIACSQSYRFAPQQHPIYDLSAGAASEINALIFAELVLIVGAVIGLIRGFRSSPSRNLGVAGTLLLMGFIFPFTAVELMSHESFQSAIEGIGVFPVVEGIMALLLLFASTIVRKYRSAEP